MTFMVFMVGINNTCSKFIQRYWTYGRILHDTMISVKCHLDAYISFDLLKKISYRRCDYLIETHTGYSGIAVMAPHGGGIEPGTASIARHLADPHHTYWSFRGISLTETNCFTLPAPVSMNRRP